MLGWCIERLAYHYKITKDGETKRVYIDTMKELRDEMADFELELAREYDESMTQG